MKKGFTLIELLAVIVILAIILLIAMPIVLNVIKEARLGAFNSTGFGLVKTAETEYFRRSLEGSTPEVEYTAPAFTGIDFSGKAPTGGSIVVRANGSIYMAVTDGVHCAYKVTGSTDVTTIYVDDMTGDCDVDNTEDFTLITTP